MDRRFLLAYPVLATLLTTTTTLADLGIKGPPQVTSQNDLTTSHPIGTSFRLDCPIEGYPRPILEWFKDGEAINTAWPRFRETSRGLRIRDAEREDSGIYVCKGVNGFGSEEVSLRLVIYDPNAPSTERSGRLPAGTLGVRPFFTDVFQKSSFKRPVGASLTLACHVDGVPEPQLVWYKDGYALPDQHHGKDIQDKAILHFTHLSPEDSGTYLCRASNSFGAVENSFQIQVVERAEKHPEILGVSSDRGWKSVVGEPVLLECQVNSEVLPHIQWLKRMERQSQADVNQEADDTILVDGRVFKLLRHGASATQPLPDGSFSKTLRILKTSVDDSGDYVCLATNEQGYDHMQASLHVLPAEPAGSLSMPVMVSIPAAGVVGALFILLAIYFWRRQRHKDRHRRHQQPAQAPHHTSTKGQTPGSVASYPHLSHPTSSSSSTHLMTTVTVASGMQGVLPSRGLRKDCWQQCQQPLLHHVSSSDQSRNSLQGVGSGDVPVADSNKPIFV